MLPIRCYTCNAPIDHIWDKYVNLLKGSPPSNTAMDALNDLGIEDECCRKFFLGNGVIGFTSGMQNEPKHTTESHDDKSAVINAMYPHVPQLPVRQDHSASSAAEVVIQIINKFPLEIRKATNGTDACWLNSSLYALVSNPIFVAVFQDSLRRCFGDTESNERYFGKGELDNKNKAVAACNKLSTDALDRLKSTWNNETDWNSPEVYKQVISALLKTSDDDSDMNEEECTSLLQHINILRLLVKARQPSSLWNGTLYKEMHETLKANGVDLEFAYGKMGNAHRVTANLINKINLGCSKPLDNIAQWLPRDEHTSDWLRRHLVADINGRAKVLISFIVSTVAPGEYHGLGDIFVSHWISFTNVDNKHFVKFNALEGTTRDTTIREMDLIPGAFFIGVYIDEEYLAHYQRNA